MRLLGAVKAHVLLPVVLEALVTHAAPTSATAATALVSRALATICRVSLVLRPATDWTWLGFLKLSITVGKVAFVSHFAVAIVFEVSALGCLVFGVIDLLLGLHLTETTSLHSTGVLHDWARLARLLLLLLLVGHAAKHHVLGRLLHLLANINANGLLDLLLLVLLLLDLRAIAWLTCIIYLNILRLLRFPNLIWDLCILVRLICWTYKTLISQQDFFRSQWLAAYLNISLASYFLLDCGNIGLWI
jgi:hypothetical protein